MVKFVENELLNIKTEVNDMWQLGLPTTEQCL